MTGKVISLDDHRPHQASYVACMECGRDWVAVFPTGVAALECPACHAMAGEPVQIHNAEWISRYLATVKTAADHQHRTMVCINAKWMEQGGEKK